MIVLTQFTRAIYRGTPQMFAGDNKALGITTMAIFRGYTRALPPLQCVFLPCIVLTCQENLHCHVSIFLPPHLATSDIQELAAEMWINFISPKLSKEDPLRVIQNNFTNSLKIMKKFGRFPHRNQVLGRKSTDDEVRLYNVLCNDVPIRLSFWSKSRRGAGTRWCLEGTGGRRV